MIAVRRNALAGACVLSGVCIASLIPVQLTPHRALVPSGESVLVALGPLLLISVIFLRRGRLRVGSGFHDLAIVSLLAILAWAFVTAAPLTSSGWLSARRAVAALGSTLCIVGAFYFFRPQHRSVWRFTTVLVCVGTALSVLGLAISFLGGGYTQGDTGTFYQTLDLGVVSLTHEVRLPGGFPRITSLTANPNTLGFFAGLAALILGVAVYQGRYRFLPTLPFLLVNLGALLHSFSRSAMLALGIGLVMVACFDWRARTSKLALGGGIAAFAGSIFFRDPVQSLLAAREGVGLTGREVAWTTALRAHEYAPLRGYGFGMANELVLRPEGVDITMHNTFLSVLVETGIIGVALYATFLLAVVAGILLRLTGRPSSDARNAIVMTTAIILFILGRSIFEGALLRPTWSNTILMVFVGSGLTLERDAVGGSSERRSKATWHDADDMPIS